MPKKKAAIHGKRRGESRGQNIVLLLVSAAFLLGGILGWLAGEKMASTAYVQMFLDAAEAGALSPGLGREFWNVFRWPVVVILLGMLPLSGVSIPGILCLRGFLLSYSITSFLEAGVWEGILLFGPTCVLTLPVLFLVSTGVLKKAGESRSGKPAVILTCLLALILCMVLDLAVVPILLA